ncbi:MAG: type II secretion system protein E [Acidimicrobiales bacterium]|nr:MAG: type II secretion system protein E [Acidimicrobiales bacterium]
MSLYKRLQEAKAEPKATRLTERATSSQLELRNKIHEQLIEELGSKIFDRNVSAEELRKEINDKIVSLLAKERTPLSQTDRQRLIEGLISDIVGYGPLDPLLEDDSVTDIMVNGPYSVYCERGGNLEKTEVRFHDETHLKKVIDKIVGQVGRRIDEANPMCDARLPDGSRVHAVIHPVALGGPYLTIRKFARERLTIEHLIEFGTVTPEAAKLLQAMVLGRLNVIIAGGSSTGKTTLLNVMSGFIPPEERIVTIEDAKELQLQQEHVLSMETRPPNVEGTGEITIRDLVRNSLRMRPDRIIVGECRGGEALDMLQAMNTGHDGSLTTVHANTPSDALKRLETLVLMAGYDLPVRAIREQMASAIDCIVQMNRLRDGSRRITSICEVQGMEGDEITLLELFRFDFSKGTDGHGRYLGRLEPLGVIPQFMEVFENFGVDCPPEIFLKSEEKALSAPPKELPGAAGESAPHRTSVPLFADDASALQTGGGAGEDATERPLFADDAR